MDISAFKPLNLQQLYQGADAAVAQAMQTNMLVLQSSRMKQEFDTEDQLRTLAKNSVTTGADGAPSFDLKSFTKNAYAIDPMKAIGYEKAVAEADKATLDRANTQSQIDERRMTQAANRLKHMNEASTVPFLKYKELTEKGVPDADARAQVQPLYQGAVQNLVSSGLFDEKQLAQFQLKPEFDPVKAEAGMRQVLGAKDSLGEYWKGREFKQKADQHEENKQIQIRGQNITLRGQNMTDQRSRDQLAQQGLEVKDNEDGTYSVIHKASGKSFPVLDQNGQPLKTGKSQGTEGERVAAGYASRMTAAERILGGIETGDQKPGIIEGAVSVVPWAGAELAQGVRSLPAVGSAERQKALQAQMDWVRAKLRKESGAVIGPQEMVDEIKTYFPVIGDREEVVQQKAEARQRAADAMVQQAGKAFKAPAKQPGQEAKGKIGDAPVQISNAEEYAKLKDGQAYLDPKGVRRVKGQKAGS